MFSGFNITERLYHSPHVLVVRAQSVRDRTSVVIKIAPPASSGLSKLRYEYDVLQKLQKLNTPQIPTALSLQAHGGDSGEHEGLVMEDIGGTSLAQLLGGRRMPWAEALAVAEQIARGLGAVHAARLVHKDLNPNNIVLNRSSGRVQVIDFGIASQLTQETPGLGSLHLLEGSPPYIAPEQTGRTNRSVDHRSDFFALGVTLYELLTGQLPFMHTELADLVYAVLTAVPPHPAEVCPDLPTAVGDVVMRLLQKDPQRRYQSAHGLAVDLTHCLDALPQPAPFSLGRADRIESLQVPRTLYGRNAELQLLQDAYHAAQAQAATELVMVDGTSGIGKSSLLHALQPTLLRQHGLFLAGKHSEVRRHMPFHAMAQALAGWVQQILTEPDAQLDVWRRRLRGALGAVGQALVALVPELELVVGAQKPVLDAGARENENRLLMLFQRVVQMLCKDQSLVLLLDDLQWADPGSLRLLQLLISRTPTQQGLLIMGAYRANEVGAAHPLRLLLHDVAAQLTVQYLHLAPLQEEHVQALLEEAMGGASSEPVKALAQLLHSRSQGNPFFLHALLAHLWTQQSITFNAQAGRFVWDLDAIQSAPVPDNAVQLITYKIDSLPPADASMLCVAACVGDRFSLGLLCAITQQTRSAVADHLLTALQEGLLVCMDGAYRYVNYSTLDPVYRFAHDRVREAAYTFSNPEQVQRTHHAIGQVLMQRGSADPLTVVQHVNKALHLLQNATDQRRVADLNVRAAREAKRSVAYSLARRCYGIAQRLLESDASLDPALAFALQWEHAEAEFLDGANTAALARLHTLAQTAATPVDRARVQALCAAIYDSAAQYDAAMAAAQRGLVHVGYALRGHSPWTLVGLLLRVGAQAAVTSPAQLLAKPACTDARVVQAMNLLGAITLAAVNAGTVTLLIALLSMARLTMKHGRSPTSAFAYSLLSGAFATFSHYGWARTYAQLAETLAEGPDAQLKCGVDVVLTVWGSKHLELSPQELSRACVRSYGLGRETGDLAYAGWSAVFAMVFMLHASLERAEELAEGYAPFVLRPENPEQRATFLLFRQVGRALRGRTRGPTLLDDDTFGEAEMEAFARTQLRAPAVCDVWVAKLMVCALHGDHVAGLLAVQRLHAVDVYRTIADPLVATFCFYGALTLLAAPRPPTAPLRRMLRKLRALAQHAPQRFSGEYLTVRAAWDAKRGHRVRAAHGYSEACTHAGYSDWYDRKGMMLEQAADFFARNGQVRAAQEQSVRAFEAYRVLGASTKLARVAASVAARAPADLDPPEATPSASRRSTTRGTLSLASDIDLPGLMEAAGAIARETHHAAVVQKILEALRKVAGATRSVLLLLDPEDGTLHKAADTAAVDTAVPQLLLQYALRSKRPVLTDDAQQGPVQDPYFAQGGTRGVLCAPIAQQGIIKGLIYLENSVTVGAFAPQRLGVVELLAAQAAIALNNAKVVANLEAEVQRRSQELRAAHARLMTLERDSTEVQMAGGFAHEMRNALTTAQFTLATLYPVEEERNGFTVFEVQDRLLGDLQAVLQDAPQAAQILPRLAPILAEWNQDRLQAISMFQNTATGLRRGLRLTQTLLDYAQAGQIVTGDDSTPLRPLVDEILRDLKHTLEARKIATEVHVDAQVALPMKEAHAHTILRNLIANAADAMAADPAQADAVHRLRVHASVQIGVQESLQVAVSDTGVGISAEAQARVFQPFFTTKGFHGTGLGLGLSRKLARVYGGELAFESRPNIGTTFRLIFARR